ncbi:ion transporter [Paracoccus sp. R12_1]|uniref:ion transporter n=1 Tax=unclassified Paracoccus (in: a-proteobacteria) TaxID=2688777 RepID=UPI001ADD1BA5|nr:MULTISPECIES: ion transporter [unclassified Paracoccus (in: a-proteobacteria)]MBO9456805.1 ion transporter [Paracoccus sp. R12_2]MBO9487901.1 ion transporter [Paracoccus sp. R12_1]
MNGLRERIDRLVHGRIMQGLITAVILFNALILGLETSAVVMARLGPMILFLDALCLAVFVIEIAAKLFARGWRFFRDGWNIFDFAVVGIALVPAAQGLSVLRALRILRLLRIVSVTPRLRRVVEGFLSALPGMASVFLLMGIIFYIAAVIATKLFGQAFPEWFGTLGDSAYSLFQIMTLESWSMGIVRPVMEVYPNAWAFFVPFILVTTFAVMNLVVGLIVNSMQDAHQSEENEITGAYRDQVLARLESIERRLSAQADDRSD